MSQRIEIPHIQEIRELHQDFWASFVKNSKVSDSANITDNRDVDCFKCHKKGLYSNKCPDGKGFFKVRRLEEKNPSI